MPFFDQLTKAWIDRQYRMTYRAVLNGLLAGGMKGDEAIQQAHELTLAALQQFRAARATN